MKISRLHTNGNSCGVYIPRDYRRALGWKAGDYLYIELRSNTELVIRSLNEHLKTTRKKGARTDDRAD